MELSGKVVARRTFHTTIDIGGGGILTLTKENFNSRKSLYEGQIVKLEFDDTTKKWKVREE